MTSSISILAQLCCMYTYINHYLWDTNDGQLQLYLEGSASHSLLSLLLKTSADVEDTVSLLKQFQSLMTLWLKKCCLILLLTWGLWSFLEWPHVCLLLGNWFKSLFWGWLTNLYVSSMSLHLHWKVKDCSFRLDSLSPCGFSPSPEMHLVALLCTPSINFISPL